MSMGSQDGGSIMESSRSQNRMAFGGEAERIGTRLDDATDEFLKETRNCAALQINPGQDQLTAFEYANYLGIDFALEPEMAWVAREMCAAPCPPNAKMKVSKAGVVYFHDIENDYYTIEHPLTQRYLKVLERSRLDALCMRTKPSVNGLILKQPDMLFAKQFRNMQIPCQSCGVMQATLRCNQSYMFLCQGCWDALTKHSQGPRKKWTFTPTSFGSLCSSCTVKKPQVFSAKYEDYFCFKCYETMQKKGKSDKAVLVSVSDGDIIEPSKKCEECGDKPAAFNCDYCQDNFCTTCFWKCHFNGHRRNHTASKVNAIPMCNQCGSVRATIFNEQTQELLCTECFTMMHHKGNRMLHMFMDAMDLLVLLERLDPAFQEHMRRARPRVLWAITHLQGWVRGIEARRNFAKRKDVVMQIQRRWRGVQTRRRLLGTLHMHKWRRRQVNNYFLPKTSEERRTVKQKTAAMLAAKEVTHRSANASLRELKDTILRTSSADPMEDAQRTRQTIINETAVSSMQPAGWGGGSGSGAVPAFAQTVGGGPSPHTSYDDTSRFALTGPMGPGGADRGADLSTKDIRKVRDTTLRQITRLDHTQ
jgi:hypothetical protein